MIGFKNIMQSIDQKANEDLIISLIKRLNSSEFYCSKHAVSILIPLVYKQVSFGSQNALFRLFFFIKANGFSKKKQKNFQSIYKNLTINDIPIVRKFAAKNMASLLKVLPLNLEKDIMEMIGTIIKDDQDLVRIYMVEALIPLAGLLPPQKHHSVLIPLFNILAEDQSWRIKYAICERCQEVNRENMIFFLLILCWKDRRSVPERIH